MNMRHFLTLIKSLWCPFHLHRYNLTIISSSGAWSWWTAPCPTCSSSLLSRHPKQQVISSINVVIVTDNKLVHNKLGSLRATSSFEDYFEKSHAGINILPLAYPFFRSTLRSPLETKSLLVGYKWGWIWSSERVWFCSLWPALKSHLRVMINLSQRFTQFEYVRYNWILEILTRNCAMGSCYEVA